jgi:hypothetical protein
MKYCEYCSDMGTCETYGVCWNPPGVKKNAGGPGTPETDAIWAENKDSRDPAKIEGDLIEHAEKLERERDAAIAALQDATRRAQQRARWCILSRDGWCGAKGGKRPATTENNVETRCGMWVAQPWGIERREPTCPDCIKSNV